MTKKKKNENKVELSQECHCENCDCHDCNLEEVTEVELDIDDDHNYDE